MAQRLPCLERAKGIWYTETAAEDCRPGVRMAFFAGDKKYRSKADGPPGLKGTGDTRDLRLEKNAARRAACQLRASKAGRSWKGGARERADGVFFCRRQKKDAGAKRTLLRRGAEGGTRTHTVSLPTDFESVTSANSITSARNSYIIPLIYVFVNKNLAKRSSECYNISEIT